MKTFFNFQRGFTLVEVLIAGAILALLITALILGLSGGDAAKTTSCKTTNDKIVAATKEYDYQVAVKDLDKIKESCKALNKFVDKFNKDKCGEIEGLSPYERKECPQ